jgi:hypothetical protein
MITLTSHLDFAPLKLCEREEGDEGLLAVLYFGR